MGKKDKAAEPETITVTAEAQHGNQVVYSVELDPAQAKPPINIGLASALRDEIAAKLPELRNLAHCQPIVFFCEEVLRAVNGLESNLNSYCEKLRLEAQRAATGQGVSK